MRLGQGRVPFQRLLGIGLDKAQGRRPRSAGRGWRQPPERRSASASAKQDRRCRQPRASARRPAALRRPAVSKRQPRRPDPAPPAGRRGVPIQTWPDHRPGKAGEDHAAQPFQRGEGHDEAQRPMRRPPGRGPPPPAQKRPRPADSSTTAKGAIQPWRAMSIRKGSMIQIERQREMSGPGRKGRSRRPNAGRCPRGPAARSARPAPASVSPPEAQGGLPQRRDSAPRPARPATPPGAWASLQGAGLRPCRHGAAAAPAPTAAAPAAA